MSQGTASARDVVLGAGPVGENVAERTRQAVADGVDALGPVPSYPTVRRVWLRLLETYRSGNVIEG